MEHSSASASSSAADRRARLKHWLLTRRHLRTSLSDHPDTRLRTPLIRDTLYGLIAWSLTRTTLLFSVTPLPIAAVLATPSLPLAPTLGVLFGLWQGAPHPTLTIGTLAIGLVLRLVLRLFFQPMSDANAAAQHRKAYLAHWRLLLCRCMLPFLSKSQHNSTAHNEEPTSSDQAAESEGTALLSAIEPLPVSSRTLNAVLAATVGALFYCLHGAFAFYDLWGALLFVCGCALACPLFCFSLDHIAQQFEPTDLPTVPNHGILRPLIGHATLLCSICFCLRGVRFLSLMPALALLLWLSLLLLPRYGLLLSLGCAVLGGLVIGTPCIPALGVCLVLYALLSPILPKLAPPCALLGALLVALTGGKALFFELATSLCVGVALLTATRAVKAQQSTAAKSSPSVYRHDPIHAAYQSEKMRYDSISNRLSAISTAFDGLGEILLRAHQPSSTPSPPTSLLPTSHDTPRTLHDARQYDAIAGLFKDALAENFKALPPDDEFATRIGQQLRQANAKFRHVVCLTHRGRCLVRIEGCTPTHIGMAPDALRRLCEEVTDCMLRLPVFDEDSDEGGTLLLLPRPALRVQCIFRSCAAGEASPETAAPPLSAEQTDTPRAKATKVIPCGDSIRFFSDGQEHFFALLCDGMGSGEDAAAISGICVSFLERLLRAGVGIDSALTLLNQHLCSRSISAAEFTSTVDLISVDLFSGKAHFIKSGAADSLILRGDQWYTVSSRTYPLGVLHSVDAQILPFSLQAGDRILMMSDGVMDTLLPEAITASSDADPGGAHLDLSEQPGWLYALLDTASLQSDSSTRDFLDRILTCARQHGSVDDMTVALLRVVAN